MPRMTKTEKALDQSFHETYRRLGDGIQVNMMDLGKLHDEAITAARSGMPMDQAVADVIVKYRKN